MSGSRRKRQASHARAQLARGHLELRVAIAEPVELVIADSRYSGLCRIRVVSMPMSRASERRRRRQMQAYRFSVRSYRPMKLVASCPAVLVITARQH